MPVGIDGLCTAELADPLNERKGDRYPHGGSPEGILGHDPQRRVESGARQGRLSIPIQDRQGFRLGEEEPLPGSDIGGAQHGAVEQHNFQVDGVAGAQAKMLNRIILAQVGVPILDLAVANEVVHLVHMALIEDPDLGTESAHVALGAAGVDLEPAVIILGIVAHQIIMIKGRELLVGVDEIEVQIAVVVDIADGGAAGVAAAKIKTGGGILRKIALAVIDIESIAAEIGVQGAADEKVEIAVIVRIEEDAGESPADQVADGFGKLGKVAGSVILIDACVFAADGVIIVLGDDKGIEVAVIIIVGEGRAVAVIARLGEAAGHGFVLEIAFAVIDKELIIDAVGGLVAGRFGDGIIDDVAVADKDIHVAVVVNIDAGDSLRALFFRIVVGQAARAVARFRCECAIAVIDIELVRLWRCRLNHAGGGLHRPPVDAVEIEPAVAVDIDRDEAAGAILRRRDARRFAHILEPRVAEILVKAAGVIRGRIKNVVEAVVVVIKKDDAVTSGPAVAVIRTVRRRHIDVGAVLLTEVKKFGKTAIGLQLGVPYRITDVNVRQRIAIHIGHGAAVAIGRNAVFKVSLDPFFVGNVGKFDGGLGLNTGVQQDHPEDQA